MTLQERLAMTQGQDNGMDIILGGIPAAAQQEQVQQLPATALRPKSNHTFKVRTGSPHYTALVDSIRSSGIRTPLLVRRDPVQPGAYEIIAGHTRWTAAQELGLATVPCIVAQLSDADADIMMAETNIQRPDWLPSERAKTYAVWMEATRRSTGIKAGGDRTKEQTGTEFPFALSGNQCVQSCSLSWATGCSCVCVTGFSLAMALLSPRSSCICWQSM